MEHLPTQPRDLNFRMTVNDNHQYNYNGTLVNNSGVNSDDIKITVVDNGGPFFVTSQATSVTYNGGSSQIVSWNVNGTNLTPISTANVRISLSTDGGFTFPIELLASTSNNGSATVVIPNIQTDQARIKVEAIDNIYFDISNTDFTINQNQSVPGIAVTQTGGNTLVSETGQSDTYEISLLSTPTGNVSVLIEADDQTEVSLDGVTYSKELVIQLNNTSHQVITVRGQYDIIVEAGHFGTIIQKVVATNDPTNYPISLYGTPITAQVADAQIPPVIGIDFDTDDTDIPLNWIQFDRIDGQMANNISLDDGTPTLVDVSMTADNCGIGGCSFGFSHNSGINSPQHIQPLDVNLNGVSVSRGNVSITWSDLKPTSRYRVFVFASNVVNAPTQQTISIVGNGVNDPAPFVQNVTGSTEINDQTSTNSPLINFGKIVTPDASGTIVINVVSDGEIWISGLALQEVLGNPNCETGNLTLMGITNSSKTYTTNGTIFSTQHIQGLETSLYYNAETAIQLNQNFEIDLGSKLQVQNVGCEE